MLGAVAERPTHGYAVARLLAPQGALGRIWTITRGDVYQSIKKLIKLGLISERSTEPGSGPDRTVLAVTPRGRRVVARWLKEPVEHVRDGRTLLLLKLTLLDRADGDMGPLIEAQRARFEPTVEALEVQCRRANGVELMVLRWRLESSRAALDFLRHLADHCRQPEA